MRSQIRPCDVLAPLKKLQAFPEVKRVSQMTLSELSFRLQTSDFRDIYLNRIAEKVKQYLSGCVPVDDHE